MSAAPDDQANPYIGPRTFTYEQRNRFYGRDREARDLLSRIISTRVLLFYAQSGAGKSSILNTRIIPGLRSPEVGFDVLPIGRVGGDLPPGVADVDNIYVFNLLTALDRAPENQARLAELSLKDFLAGLVSDDGLTWRYAPSVVAKEEPVSAALHRYVLIIDQFEELVRGHPDRWREREAFFTQLDAALRADASLSVVLTLRADYVAALDPYAHLVQDRLSGRFYMENLGIEAALEAIRRPAKEAGREFEPGAAELLAKNLSQVQVPGREETVDGEYVEPVQLQVVCYRLWEKVKDKPPGPITKADVETAGDVDSALTDFYNDALQTVVTTPGLGVTEPDLRRWFSTKLITPAGTRGIVFRGEHDTEGMPNAVVDSLQNQFLLRTEPRAGGEWVELVHDRFVDPILRANRRAQTPLARDADEWEKSDHNAMWLYEGQKLRDARAALVAEPSKHSEIERKFVAAGEQRRRRLIAGVVTGVALLLIFAGLAFWGWRNATLARDQQQLALSRQLAAQSANLEESRPDLGLLLGNEAYQIADTAEARGAPLTALLQNPAMLSRLDGASDWVWSVALSPDGKTLAEASADKKIRLWDVSNPRRPQVLGEPLTDDRMSYVYSVAFRPDGKLLASAGGDNFIRLWDVSDPAHTFRVAAPLEGHKSQVWVVAFSPDGKILASGSFDNTIRLWDVSDPTQPKPLGEPLQGHKGWVRSAAFSPDGKTLASGSYDTTIRLWDVSDPTQPKPLGEPLAGHSGWVWSVAFSPDGKTLASGSWDNTIRLWDVSNPAQAHWAGVSLENHTDNVNSVAFRPDGKILASASADNTIRLWDVSNIQQAHPLGQPLTGHTSWVYTVAFSPNGKMIASGSADNTGRLWDVSNPAQPHSLEIPLTGHAVGVRSVAVSRDGKLLASGGADQTIRLWAMSAPQQAQPLGEPLTGHKGWVWSVAFSPDSKTLASASGDWTVRLWDVSNPQQARFLGPSLGGHSAAIRAVAFSPNGKTLATGSDDKTIILWDVSKPDYPQPLGAPLAAHTNGVRSVAFSPDGKTLASGSDDGTIILWDVSNPAQPRKLGAPLTGHRGGVWSVAFSPNGQLLASGSADNDVRLWDVARPDQAHALGVPLTGHTSPVWSVAFSPNGNTLASASWDDTIRLWYVANVERAGALGAPLADHTGQVVAVTFSPDGKTLVSGSVDTTIRLWDVDPQSWQARACRLAGRNLTLDEWNQYIGPDIRYHKTCPDQPPGDGAPDS